MKILAIDTATEACSAALLIDGELRSRYGEPKRGHAELILPMVDELLQESGLALARLDAIAVGRGPGAFTGVRIAMSVAQGLAFGAGLNVIPVSTLAAIAQRALRDAAESTVLVCIDARMHEVYSGAFTRVDGLATARTDELVAAPAVITAPWSDTWIGVGTGWAAYPELATLLNSAGHAAAHIDGSLLPHAEDIARLAVRELRAGNAVPPAQAQPIYLRDKVATPPRG